MQHIGEANSNNFKNRDLYAGEAKEEQQKKKELGVWHKERLKQRAVRK